MIRYVLHQMHTLPAVSFPQRKCVASNPLEVRATLPGTVYSIGNLKSAAQKLTNAMVPSIHTSV